MSDRLGFIGIGTMGTPMSRRLVAAGYQLVAYDVNPRAMAPLLELGAEAGASPADVAERCSKVITILPNSGIVEQVVLGPSGLAEGFSPGSVLMEMSSALPTSTRKLAEALAAKGVAMVDAPVSGGPAGAADGTLAIMVGGAEEIYQGCLPILQAMGKNIFHIGPTGSGHTMKTLNNMMFAVNMLGVCEGLVLGVKAGLEPEKIVEVISKSSGRSFALDTKAVRHILPRNYQPGFTTDLLYKDVDIATSLGRQMGVPMLAANLAHQILAVARGRGMNALDNACILKLLEEAAGVEVVAGMEATE
ncbi:MAG: NAD(P)-dependent oxidoreductase [Chloroflexota bacterium]